jgi:hypothetical protein
LFWGILIVRLIFYAGSALDEIAKWFRKKNIITVLGQINLEREKAGLPFLSKEEYKKIRLNS